jgi:hypothetical protein
LIWINAVRSQDHAADDLRSHAVTPDGSFDIKEFAKWRREHDDALLALLRRCRHRWCQDWRSRRDRGNRGRTE